MFVSEFLSAGNICKLFILQGILCHVYHKAKNYKPIMQEIQWKPFPFSNMMSLCHFLRLCAQEWQWSISFNCQRYDWFKFKFLRINGVIGCDQLYILIEYYFCTEEFCVFLHVTYMYLCACVCTFFTLDSNYLLVFIG